MANGYNYNSHLVPTPSFIPYLQVLIILFSTAVIGLTSYPLTFDDGGKGNGFMNFVAVGTVIGTTYFLISVHIRRAWSSYHRIAHLVLLVLAVCVWAGAFIGEAETIARTIVCARDSNGHWSCTKTESEVDGKLYRPEMIVAASMGVIVFALFVINLITYSIFFHRHRCAKGPVSWGAWRNGQQARPQGEQFDQQGQQIPQVQQPVAMPNYVS